ncbi:prolyl aminopeptidase [Gordonia araii NBRC 100433]|uniref:Prolyl aminopeptidase n=1 Tax=Gordonia araii NBRC 100433 TaxID=1073574 RepID=G7H1Y1_9ACTN|nr:alpha/beta fold hydrolase [Gordonia araii]NNG97189.1 alpha/beta fold hydrolase [Gordonia araii NBRC 100433]GAB09856.1 prolyl aminopeptidase [Gordonia araii NBRC 100433]
MADKRTAPTMMRRLAEREVTGHVRRPAGGTDVEIAYFRPSPSTGLPVVMIPGGPGMASALPYRSLRRDAVRRDLDVVMMEHRGVGLSRRDVAGNDLAVSAVTLEATVADLNAVLDDAGIGQAVIYGTSYGSYLAQLFGVSYPSRVAGMVLDSPALSARDDLAMSRRFRRELLLDGPSDTAAAVRSLVEADIAPDAELGHVVQVVYEFGGPDLLRRLALARLAGRGRRAWERLAALGGSEIEGGQPFVMEPDLVAGITYAELGSGAAPDGLPLDPEATFAGRSDLEFTGEPVDMPSELPNFDWPTAVISGERDLRTPRPVSERVAGLIPDAVLVPLADTGHSAFDGHRRAAFAVARAVRDGRHRDLPDRADGLSQLPRRGSLQVASRLIRAGIALDLRLPG